MMKSLFVGLLAVGLLAPPAEAAPKPRPTQEVSPVATSVHDFTVKTISGEERSLSAYKGKVLLIVNVASECGFTPQYKGLEALYEKYKGKGFEILGFPSNDFGGQEPGSEAEIKAFCDRNYGVSFDLFAKIHAKGEGIAPLYRWLTEDSGLPGPVTWNFNKFLVDKNGLVLQRWDSKVKPEDKALVQAVENALSL